MNVAYVVHSGPFNSVLKIMLTSLHRHCTCRLIFVSPDMTDTLRREVRGVFTQPVDFRPIPETKWHGQRVARKVWELQEIPFALGDRVLVLDSDLVIQADPFDAFDGNFDVAVTTRHYKYWYKINAGVWGVNYNEKSRRFLQFFASQIRNPTWSPFIDFKKRFEALRPIFPIKDYDWWCDQDFLCTVYDNPLPFSCRVADLGPRYNFCPSFDDEASASFNAACSEIIEKLGNPHYKVLHFKGRLKEILAMLDADALNQ